MPGIRERDDTDKIKRRRKGHKPTKSAVRRQLTAKYRKEQVKRQTGGERPEAEAADQLEQSTGAAAEDTFYTAKAGAGRAVDTVQHRRAQRKNNATHRQDETPAAPTPTARMRQKTIKEREGRKIKARELFATEEPPLQRDALPQPTPGERMKNRAVQEQRTAGKEQRARNTDHLPAESAREIPTAPPSHYNGGRQAAREDTKTSPAPQGRSIYQSDPIKERPRRSAIKEKQGAGAFTPRPQRDTAAQPPANYPARSAKPAPAGKGKAASAVERAHRWYRNRAKRKMARTAGKSAKPAAALVKSAASAVKTAVSSGIGALAGLMGGALLPVLLVVLLVGGIVASPIGIFFSNEAGTGTVTLREAIGQINREYGDKLLELQAGDYSSVVVEGGPPAWREVVAVFAVKTAGADDGVDVATLDNDRVERLRAVFWDMCSVTSEVETIDHPDSDPDDDTDDSWTERVLHITVTPRTADEMRTIYNFTAAQNSALTELLTGEYADLWQTILYGGGGDIVAIALSQVGNVGGQPYWSWYGFNSHVEWCACFVSWCANEAGYIEAGIIPKFAGCLGGSNWFKDCGLWQNNSYVPRPGDIIFFDWDDPDGLSGPQDGIPDHVGIVERVEAGYVYTVEGNSGDACRQRRYPVGYYEIYGYGTPAY